MKRTFVVAIITLIIGCLAHAQEPAPTAGEPSPELPNRWLLLCCGLPGDEEHRERLTGALQKIISAAEPVLGVSPERLRVLAGDEEMQEAIADLAPIADQTPGVGVCTKESMAEMMESLCDQVAAEDSCWVMLLGHAHLYEASSKFNVLDADFDQSEFAIWARPLACREQVFWITMPVSGFWIKPLSARSRVVISATEADLEFTGTEMPYALADLLAGDGEQQSLQDVDGDGSVSLLDLYLAANLEIHGRFTSMERLQTEHAQLEDNGDGRGSEVQLAYLPEETDEDEEDDSEEEEESEEEEPEEEADEGSDDDSDDAAVGGEETEDSTAKTKAELPQPINNRNLDGYRSRFIVIRAPQ